MRELDGKRTERGSQANMAASLGPLPFDSPTERRNVLGLALGSAVFTAGAAVIGSIGQQDQDAALSFDPLDEVQDQQLVINRFIERIEDKQQSRGRLDSQIIDGLEEEAKMKQDIDIEMDRLMKIEANIADTMTERNDIERALSDAEAELSRVLTSSSTLLEELERKSGY
jgi:septal ring factor EnvC (AmiA/AmiB activator)